MILIHQWFAENHHDSNKKNDSGIIFDVLRYNAALLTRYEQNSDKFFFYILNTEISIEIKGTIQLCSENQFIKHALRTKSD